MKAPRKSPAAGDAVLQKSESPTPELDALLKAEPGLIDRIFDYLVNLTPELASRRVEIKHALRKEFAGERVYIPKRDAAAPDTLAADVLRMFNGRNPTEIARALGIGRATVYRKLKQARKAG